MATWIWESEPSPEEVDTTSYNNRTSISICATLRPSMRRAGRTFGSIYRIPGPISRIITIVLVSEHGRHRRTSNSRAAVERQRLERGVGARPTDAPTPPEHAGQGGGGDGRGREEGGRTVRRGRVRQVAHVVPVLAVAGQGGLCRAREGKNELQRLGGACSRDGKIESRDVPSTRT